MTYAKGKSVNLSDNFESTEFDCNGKGCCSATTVDPKLVEYLQKIRNHFNAPVTINSAYRCDKHNKKVGGANKSKHLYGQAADIKVKGVSPLKVAQYAESIGIRGIGQYSNFVHIDTRTNKYFWYGSEQNSKSTFGKYSDATTSNQDIKDVETSVDTNVSIDGKTVEITGTSVNVRKGPSTTFDKLSSVARKGEVFKMPDTEGWLPIIVNNEVCWISEKYAKIK